MQGGRMLDGRKGPPYNQGLVPRRPMKEMGSKMERGQGGGAGRFGKVDILHGPGAHGSKRPMNFTGRNTVGSFRKRLTRGGAFAHAAKRKAMMEKAQLNRKIRASEGISGFIFGCTNRTEKECLRRKLFGLPYGNMQDVGMIEPGTPLFLFNYEDRVMTGVFTAASKGDNNLVPEAWGGQFPAQVRINIPSIKRRISEKVFKPILEDNYFNGHRFIYHLNGAQVSSLCKIFKQPVPKSSVTMTTSQQDPKNTESQYNLPYKQSIVMNPTTVAPTGGKLFGGIRGVTITPDSVQAPINTQWAFTGTDEGLGGNKASVPASAATDCNSNQIVFGVPQSRGGQNPVSSPAKGQRQENAPYLNASRNFQGTFQQAPGPVTFGSSKARIDSSKPVQHGLGSISPAHHGFEDESFQQKHHFGFGSHMQAVGSRVHKKPEASGGGIPHGSDMSPRQGVFTQRFKQSTQDKANQWTNQPAQAQSFGWMGGSKGSHSSPVKDVVFGSKQNMTGSQQGPQVSRSASPNLLDKPPFHMQPSSAVLDKARFPSSDLRNYINSSPSRKRPNQDTETKVGPIPHAEGGALEPISTKLLKTGIPAEGNQRILPEQPNSSMERPSATNIQGSWGFLQPDGSYGVEEHGSELAPSSGSQAESDRTDGNCKSEPRKRYPSLEYTPKPGSEFETLLASVDDLDTAFGRTHWETDETEFLVETLFESYIGKKRKADEELNYAEIEDCEYIDDMPVITAHHIKRRGIGNHSALWSVRCEGGIVGVHGQILPQKQGQLPDADIPEEHRSERSTHFVKVASGFYSGGSSPEENYKNLVHNRLSFFWRSSAAKAWSAMKEMRKFAVAENRAHLFDEVMEESGYVREHGLEPVYSGQTNLF